MKTLPALALAVLVIGSPASAQTSAWMAENSVDAFTDEERFGAVTLGDTTAAAFMCDPSGDFVAFRVVNGLIDIEAGNQRDITWRIDQEEPVYTSWLNLRDGGAMATWDEAIDVARAVRRASDRFVVRSGGKTVTFSVRGSTAAIDTAFEGCGIPVEASELQ